MAVAHHLLIIGTVWPEPNSSAAGSRMLQLIDLFLELEYRVSFASPTLKTEYAFDLREKGISCYDIKVNDAAFDEWIKTINPTHVMFDRFMMEEQFGWRVAEQCPETLRILDTEDLHCLRKARQACFKAKSTFTIDYLKSFELTKRELASIIRSDLSIMISPFEINLLKAEFQIPDSKLIHLPFLVKEHRTTYKSFQERAHFMTIGSFRHEPNVDSVEYLKKEIWPLIRKQLPDVEMHVYGSYPKQRISQLHNPKEGFIIKGWADNAHQVVESSRVMLAPLRFGAGQKGKFIDALCTGTPSITTSIGAEGMDVESDWCGYIEDHPNKIAKKAIELYQNQEEWQVMQSKASAKLKRISSLEKYLPQIKSRLESLSRESLPFYMEVLNYHSFKNSRFMSKWIEEKNSD